MRSRKPGDRAQESPCGRDQKLVISNCYKASLEATAVPRGSWIGRADGRRNRSASPSPGSRIKSLLCGLLLASVPPAAAAAEASDYGPQTETWNGLGRLLQIASRLELEVATPPRLSVDGLSSRDGLLIIAPHSALPRTGLSNFLRGGGRVAVADDFGPSDRFLRAFGIRRSPHRAAEGSLRLRGNPALQLARPASAHALVEAVPVVVTNHPAGLKHATLDPVLSLGDPEPALVLTGAVGAGRLVTVADPSIFINNMLAFPGNARFAENLLRYLTHGGGRLWVIRGDAVLESAADAGHLSPLDAFRRGLSRLSEATLPPPVLRLAAWALALSMLMAALSAMPRPTDYRSAMPLQARNPVAGVQGRIWFFRHRATNFLAPAIAFKLEFERRLTEALSLPLAAQDQELSAALIRAGLGGSEVTSAVDCLSALRELAAADQPAPVSGRRFASLVEAGAAILAQLEDRRPR